MNISGLDSHRSKRRRRKSSRVYMYINKDSICISRGRYNVWSRVVIGLSLGLMEIEDGVKIIWILIIG